MFCVLSVFWEPQKAHDEGGLILIQVTLWAGLTLRIEFGRSFTKNPRGVVKVYITSHVFHPPVDYILQVQQLYQRSAMTQAISPASYRGVPRQSARDMW